MRTVTYKSVLEGCAVRNGVIPSSSSYSPEYVQMLTEFINDRVREALEFTFWPELTLSEQRAFRDDWLVTTAYVTGDEVWDPTSEEYYIALQDNTGSTPASNPGDWGTDFTVSTLIEYEQDGKTPLGYIEGVYKDNPETCERPRGVAYVIAPTGVRVFDAGGSQVYVRFMEREPIFTSVLWSASETNVIGDLRYDTASGECYKALLSSLNVTPVGNPATWEIIKFPWAFAAYVRWAAGEMDTLREDGQHGKAFALNEEAENRLMNAAEVGGRMQGSFERAEYKSGV